MKDYLDFKKLNAVFTSVGAYTSDEFIMRSGNGFESVRGADVTAGFFRTLGVAPILGRDFAKGDDTPSGPRNVLLSYNAWLRRYGGRHDVLGQRVTLDGQATTIIGVLPRDFHFAPVGQPEYWKPSSLWDLASSGEAATTSSASRGSRTASRSSRRKRIAAA